MISKTIFKKNKKYSLYYHLKNKFNKKYKKIITYNKYNKIYNPRKETYLSYKILTRKNKFYIN